MIIEKRTIFANLCGASSVMLWGTLPALKLANSLPPLLLLTSAFFVSGLTASAICWLKGNKFSKFMPKEFTVWLIGGFCIFGSFFTVFKAFELSPPVEVHLISYLWPIQIALLSGWFLTDQKLSYFNIIGIALGLAGFIILVTDGTGLHVDYEHIDGYLLALLSAVLWTTYSLYTSGNIDVQPLTVGWFCWIASALTLICHFAFETTPTFFSTSDLWSTFLIGVGPLGIALFTWNFSLRYGTTRAVGMSALFVPIISAILLFMLGRTDFDYELLISMGFVTLAIMMCSRKGYQKLIN